KLASTPMSQVLTEARKALDDYQQSSDGVVMHRSRSVAELLANVINGPAHREEKGDADAPLTPVASAEPPLMAAPAARRVVPTAPATTAVPQAKPEAPPRPTPPAQPATYTPPSPPPAAPQVPTVAPKTLPVISAPAAPPKSAFVIPTPRAPQVQVGMPTAGSAPVVQAPAPASAGAVSGISNVPQLLMVLRESIYPAQREWAAEGLGAVGCQAYPQVPPALLKAAREDTAPTVQVACIRCLVRMNYNSQDTLAALRAMQAAGDPRVRAEAGQALVKLGGTAAGQPVVPASYTPSRSH